MSTGFEDRLTDPLSHFPYKIDEARAAAGNDVHALDEVEATAAYVVAQEAYLRSPSTETRQAERDAAGALQEARRVRRQARENVVAEQWYDADAGIGKDEV